MEILQALFMFFVIFPSFLIEAILYVRFRGINKEIKRHSGSKKTMIPYRDFFKIIHARSNDLFSKKSAFRMYLTMYSLKFIIIGMLFIPAVVEVNTDVFAFFLAMPLLINLFFQIYACIISFSKIGLKVKLWDFFYTKVDLDDYFASDGRYIFSPTNYNNFNRRPIVAFKYLYVYKQVKNLISILEGCNESLKVSRHSEQSVINHIYEIEERTKREIEKHEDDLLRAIGVLSDEELTQVMTENLKKRASEFELLLNDTKDITEKKKEEKHIVVQELESILEQSDVNDATKQKVQSTLMEIKEKIEHDSKSNRIITQQMNAELINKSARDLFLLDKQ